MSDYKAGLPVRSEADGLDERVHSKIVDFADPSGADKGQEVSEKLAHVRAFGADEGGTKRQVRLSESGNVALDGVNNAVTNTNPSSVGLIAHERSAAKDRTHQTKRVSAVDSTANTNVTALDVAMRDFNGNPYTVNNPLPIEVAESAGEEVHDYDESAVAVVADATDTHTYTVPVGKIFLLEQVLCSSSGRAKFLVQTGVVASEVSRATQFTSASNNNADISLKRTLKLAAGEVVKVTRLNRDNQPQSLYSTIVGVLKDA